MADLDFKNGWVTAAWIIAMLQGVAGAVGLIWAYSMFGPEDRALLWPNWVLVTVPIVCGAGVFLRRTGFALALMVYQALYLALLLDGLLTRGISIQALVLVPTGLFASFKAYRALKKSEVPDAAPRSDAPQRISTDERPPDASSRGP